KGLVVVEDSGGCFLFSMFEPLSFAFQGERQPSPTHFSFFLESLTLKFQPFFFTYFNFHFLSTLSFSLFCILDSLNRLKLLFFSTFHHRLHSINFSVFSLGVFFLGIF
ncbi:hypothetical protein RYX36_028426, partial [Vicia faba]